MSSSALLPYAIALKIAYESFVKDSGGEATVGDFIVRAMVVKVAAVNCDAEKHYLLSICHGCQSARGSSGIGCPFEAVDNFLGPLGLSGENQRRRN